MCKKLKFDHAEKCYGHNPETDAENKTHNLLWDVEIETDHLISARRLDIVKIKEKRELTELWNLLSQLIIE